MGTTASQIESHIEDKRESLSHNLRELESKVRSAADWRYQFENHPAAFLGAAFGGGVLLALVFRSSRGRYRYNYSFPAAAASTKEPTKTPRPRVNSPAMDNAWRAWENIKGAVVGVAASRLKDYVDEAIPGFSTQYRQAEARHKV